jgi:hypothetical protein
MYEVCSGGIAVLGRYIVSSMWCVGAGCVGWGQGWRWVSCGQGRYRNAAHVIQSGGMWSRHAHLTTQQCSLTLTCVSPLIVSVRVRVCRIVDGPVRVELQRTLHTNVPGVAFGVSAEAFSNQDDSPVKGKTTR